jgi:hypothetical protein
MLRADDAPKDARPDRYHGAENSLPQETRDAAARALAHDEIGEQLLHEMGSATPTPVVLYSDPDMVVTAVPREFSLDLLVDGSDPALVDAVLNNSGDPVQDVINACKFFAATKGIAAGTGKYMVSCGFNDPATAAANADAVLARVSDDPRIAVAMVKTASGSYRVTIESKTAPATGRAALIAAIKELIAN